MQINRAEITETTVGSQNAGRFIVRGVGSKTTVLALLNGYGKDAKARLDEAYNTFDSVAGRLANQQSITGQTAIETAKRMALAMRTADAKMQAGIPTVNPNGVTMTAVFLKGSELSIATIGSNKTTFFQADGKALSTNPHNQYHWTDGPKLGERERAYMARHKIDTTRALGFYGVGFLGHDVDARQMPIGTSGILVLGNSGFWGHTPAEQATTNHPIGINSMQAICRQRAELHGASSRVIVAEIGA